VRLLLCVLLASLLWGLPQRATAAAEPLGAWPLDPEPEVVRGFEPPPTRYASGHRGADLAGTPGQAVLAALPGTVGFAGSIGGKPVVTVLHGGRRTTYEPVVASVAPGERVGAGDVLGRLVVTDSHCFPAACLHWGLIEGTGDSEVYVDPLTLVGDRPVRLLPLWRDEPADRTVPWTPVLAGWRPLTDFLVSSSRVSTQAGRRLVPRRRGALDHSERIRWRVHAQARGCACW
jgi:murein DD-endopeptidase MepM/ murein hydrolase activator NlpD